MIHLEEGKTILLQFDFELQTFFSTSHYDDVPFF